MPRKVILVRSMDRPVPRVVHLVREANGIEPFRRFLESYMLHPAGTDHEFILLFKGFASPEAAKPYLDMARNVVAGRIHVDDRGFDLNVYLEAARQLPPGPLCFVNSFSRILRDGWLGTLAEAWRQPGVGLAGATGSWGSVRSYVRFDLGLRGPYSKAFPNRAWARQQFHEHTREDSSPEAAAAPAFPAWHGLARRVRTAGEMINRCVGFGGFPAIHVRSNGFMIDRDLFLSLQTRSIERKIDAYRLESGTHSITSQVRALGMRVVVATDGRIDDPGTWPESETFWQGDQANLLIADNQTDDYERGDADWRMVLSRYAWGAAAAPGARESLTNRHV
jgi:hypothetical protein